MYTRHVCSESERAQLNQERRVGRDLLLYFFTLLHIFTLLSEEHLPSPNPIPKKHDIGFHESSRICNGYAKFLNLIPLSLLLLMLCSSCSVLPCYLFCFSGFSSLFLMLLTCFGGGRFKEYDFEGFRFF